MTDVTTSVFSWSVVEEPWIQRILLTRSQDLRADLGAAALKALSREELLENAEHNLRRPPSKEVFRGRAVMELVRGPWLAAQPAATVDAVVQLLSVGLRNQAPVSKANRLTYLRNLNKTETLCLALRAAFVSSYKTEQIAKTQTVTIGGQKGNETVVLSGEASSPLPLYEHQRQAHTALDSWGRTRPSAGGGLVVLPTGAGKTATAVTWLLEWMSGAPDRCVLWVAHQRELVDQAAAAFQEQARARPIGFTCNMRLIHGSGSTGSTLVEPGLRIAVATVQSIWPNEDSKRVEALERFCSGQTIVVVDEAHRAASKSYSELLDVVQSRPKVRLLGLTATPTPSGAAAWQRFRQRFPQTLITVDPDELVTLGILARPVFHKVDTHISIEMSAADVRRSLQFDVPAEVLKELAKPVRDQILVEQWVSQRSLWGKTLVFATSIKHADDLKHRLAKAGAPVRSIHSRSPETRSETLNWFRTSTDDAVLVSVGMLTEGVDLPDAQTAFLARPTTSPVLMRQMVGRVLRGPRANGTSVAHLVTFHDDWVNFTGVIDPVDLRNLPEGGSTAFPDTSVAGFTLITSDGQAIPVGVLAQVQRLYADHAAVAAQGAYIADAELVGYYELSETRVPVFDHQQDSFATLIKDVLRGESLAGQPALSYFKDDPLPHPRVKSLLELVQEMRTSGAAPDLRKCLLVVTPGLTAREIRRAGALTQGQRDELVLTGWQRGGLLPYPTLDHWSEAVDRAVRELGRREAGAGTICVPETVTKPVKHNQVSRNLAPLFKSVVADAFDHLDAPEVRTRLQVLPKVRWSRRPLKTMHAHWSLNGGDPVITVSASLQVSPKHVSDELLRYLLWHELLHHVLPGHGHDAQFRNLEARWPNALDLDRQLDTLGE